MELRKYLHLAVWFIFFFAGFIEIIGLNYSLFNLIALFFVVILFGFTIIRRSTRLPYLGLIIILTIVSVISGPLINRYSAVSTFYFFRQLILLQYMYFVIVVNERNDRVILIVSRWIIALFMVQVMASLVKFATIGPMESYIGTMSIREGSLTTIFTLIAISYLFSKFLFKRQGRLIIYIFAFVIFSQIGEKRAPIIYLPLVIGTIYLFYIRITGVRASIILKRGIIMTLLGITLLYSFIRLNPTLNQDEKMWGKFSRGYAVDYILKYNQPRYDLRDFTRFQALGYFYNYMASQEIVKTLFGEGAGKLSNVAADGIDPVYYHYGIRYGGRMGVVWIFMQIGVVGLTLYLVLFFKILLFVLKRGPISYHKLAFLGIWLTVMLDLFTYSMVSIRFFVVNGTLFFYGGIFYRDYFQNKQLLGISGNRK